MTDEKIIVLSEKLGAALADIQNFKDRLDDTKKDLENKINTLKLDMREDVRVIVDQLKEHLEKVDKFSSDIINLTNSLLNLNKDVAVINKNVDEHSVCLEENLKLFNDIKNNIKDLSEDSIGIVAKIKKKPIFSIIISIMAGIIFTLIFLRIISIKDIIEIIGRIF